MPQDTDKNYRQQTEKERGRISVMKKMAENNYRPQTARDRELKTYTTAELKQLSAGKNIRPKVIPGTQDTGSVAGALGRGHIEAGTTAKVGMAHRDHVKDNYNVSRLSDSQMANKYTAEQTGKMRAKLSGRKSSVGKAGTAGAGMAALLGMKLLGNRGRGR